MPNKIDLTGMRFHRWTVLSQADTVKQVTKWECRCECGTHAAISTDSLRRGASKSCGCLKRELAKERLRKITLTHGASKTSLYRVWRAMRHRCANPHNEKYPLYGGRGIRVCPEWEDFSVFARDMGERPSASHSLDRIDVNGNYEPSNVRWATQREQQNNRRDNRRFTVCGELLTSAEIGRRFKIDPNLLRQRIDRDGMSIDKAIKWNGKDFDYALMEVDPW